MYNSEYSNLLISAGKLKENYRKIKTYVGGGDFISVVKANAYGLGVKQIAKTLNLAGQNMFAVATLKEGIYLRKRLGDKPKIFIFGAVDERDFIASNKFKLIVPIISLDFLERLKQTKISPKKVYLQVDTGMNRLGLKCDKETINQAIAYLTKNKFEFFGVFSHFALGKNEDISHRQISRLKGLDISALSFSASDATAKNYDLKEIKRIGLAMLGFGELAEKLNLKTIASLKTKIIRLERAKTAERVGYNRYFVDKDCYLATIPLGYADGIKRSYVGEMVRINRCLYPIVSICMDMSIIKVDKNVKMSDKVIIFDKDLKLERLAKADNTIVYECLTSLGGRIIRKKIR